MEQGRSIRRRPRHPPRRGRHPHRRRTTRTPQPGPHPHRNPAQLQARPATSANRHRGCQRRDSRRAPPSAQPRAEYRRHASQPRPPAVTSTDRHRRRHARGPRQNHDRHSEHTQRPGYLDRRPGIRNRTINRAHSQPRSRHRQDCGHSGPRAERANTDRPLPPLRDRRTDQPCPGHGNLRDRRRHRHRRRCPTTFCRSVRRFVVRCRTRRCNCGPDIFNTLSRS